MFYPKITFPCAIAAAFSIPTARKLRNPAALLISGFEAATMLLVDKPATTKFGFLVAALLPPALTTGILNLRLRTPRPGRSAVRR
ncbi:hypothetical protein [Nonomuraea roseoviolacea]|uniref:hypothetical protein n=1 Tax=Nonomuraea roseoviolacea TaxID=103837 RepID=UPI0031E133DC